MCVVQQCGVQRVLQMRCKLECRTGEGETKRKVVTRTDGRSHVEHDIVRWLLFVKRRGPQRRKVFSAGRVADIKTGEIDVGASSIACEGKRHRAYTSSTYIRL